MSTIYLLLVCAVITLVSCDLTPEMREELVKVQNECMKETGATDEMIMNAYAGVFTEAPELVEQIICVGKHSGMLDDDGHLHGDVLKEKLMMVFDDEVKIDGVITKCLVEKETIQETAKSSALCMFEELNSDVS